MNYEKLYETLASVGHPPCLGCNYFERCATEEQACRDFLDFVRYGRTAPPAETLAWRRKRRTLHKGRCPSRRYYNRVFCLHLKRSIKVKVTLSNVRLAFPNLWTPETVNGEGEPRYGASFLMPKNHPDIAKVNAAIDAVAAEKWGAKAKAIVQGLRQQDKVCLHDGDGKPDYDGFPGNLYVQSASPKNSRPTVVDRDRTPLVEEDGKPFGGCFVNAIVEIWAQDNNYGKRINAQLKGVQYVRDGDRFGGASPASADEFDELAVDAEESSLVA